MLPRLKKATHYAGYPLPTSSSSPARPVRPYCPPNAAIQPAERIKQQSVFRLRYFSKKMFYFNKKMCCTNKYRYQLKMSIRITTKVSSSHGWRIGSSRNKKETCQQCAGIGNPLNSLSQKIRLAIIFYRESTSVKIHYIQPNPRKNYNPNSSPAAT